MPSEVILPRVDMDMATGKIAKWLVEPGASVSKGQPLFEIETDKATMEIEAEATGTIRDLAEAGSVDIPVGSVVAWIDAAGEISQAEGTAGSPEVGRPAPAARQVPAPTAPAAPLAEAIPARDTRPGRTRATPLARRLARAQGIDLGGLRGSGPRGRIQAADIGAQARHMDGQIEPTLRDVQAPSTNLAELWTDAPAPQTNAPVARTDGPTPTVPPAAQPRSASMGADAVAVRRLRDGTGAPILLVHGFGADANGWRPLLPSLTTSRPVIGLDLPGHGGSPAGDAAALDDLVEVAGSAAAAYGPLHVVAHSLGAAVMTVVAERGLADIRSLLLLSPAGLGPDINGPFMQGFLAGSSEASLTPWLRELVADPEAITPAFVRATLKARDGTDRVAAQRRLADALFPDGTQAFSIRANLARLALPIRVVFGTADRIIPARHAAVLPPLAALNLLASLGHMPHLEASGTVAAILGQMATT